MVHAGTRISALRTGWRISIKCMLRLMALASRARTFAGHVESRRATKLPSSVFTWQSSAFTYCGARKKASGSRNRSIAEDMHFVRDLPSVAEVQIELQKLTDDINVFAEAHPNIDGTEKLFRLLKGKIAAGLTTASSGSVDGNGGTEDDGSAVGASDEAPCIDLEGDDLVKHIQGCVNNLRGVRAELLAAELFPGVKAVGKSFYSRPGEGQVFTDFKYPDIVNNIGSSRRGLGVEIDVVAQGGAWWVEVKSHERFGINSTHWAGRKGHVKGLKDQAEERLAVASCPCNLFRWQPPRVIFFFPEGIDGGVAEELRAMGATVVDGQTDFILQLPPAPPPIQYANLDVTTMCALVSEVSNGGAVGGGTPEVRAWAERISHWVDSVEEEAKDPILPQLHAVFEGRTLIASLTAVEHFEKLLAMCGGPREKQRWHALCESLVIVSPPGESSSGSGSDGKAAEDGDVGSASSTSQPQVAANEDCIRPGMLLVGWPTSPSSSSSQPSEFFSQRVARLQQVAAQQKWVFGLGDQARAITVTANGKLVKVAAKQGVALECYVHRAMWLAGM